MIKWFKKSPFVPYVGMWLAIAFTVWCWSFLALAGGPEIAFEGNDRYVQQKAIRITVDQPEDDWTDHLAWAVPGVLIPIAGWYINKKRKND